jgi:hypothetical protein
MNLSVRYENLKRKANEFMLNGLLNEYLKVLKELNRIEKQIAFAVKWN